MLARQRRIRRKRIRAAGVAVILAAAGLLAIAASGGGDGTDGEETAPSPTSRAGATTSTTSLPAGTGTSGPAGTTPPGGGDPVAPWRSAALPRDDVSGDILRVWERAENRAGCALLVPSELGTKLAGATGEGSSVNDDAGWEISFRKGPAVVQIQGLFAKATRSERTDKEIFSRRWADGSVARYGPDAQDEETTGADPETTANEATLILPDQDCAYVLYDTQGKTHLEFILGHLRFVAGTE